MASDVALVRYSSASSVAQAVRQLNGTKLGPNLITVEGCSGDIAKRYCSATCNMLPLYFVVMELTDILVHAVMGPQMLERSTLKEAAVSRVHLTSSFAAL